MRRVREGVRSWHGVNCRCGGVLKKIYTHINSKATNLDLDIYYCENENQLIKVSVEPIGESVKLKAKGVLDIGNAVPMIRKIQKRKKMPKGITRVRWTSEEEKELINLYVRGYNHKQMGVAMDRTSNAIVNRLLRLRKRMNFTNLDKMKKMALQGLIPSETDELIGDLHVMDATQRGGKDE
jgi:hypothetical protein